LMERSKAPVTNQCPFCGNYAYAASVGDAYRLDCRYCEIQVEITKRAYAARCPNPVAVLDYIREKMKVSTRPRVDIADMKRSTLLVALEETMTSRDHKETETPPVENDMLTTAAKAIGTTLGKIAVRSGMATPPPAAARVPKKAAPKKKTPAAKAAAGAKAKTTSKRSPKKSAGLAKGRAPRNG